MGQKHQFFRSVVRRLALSLFQMVEGPSPDSSPTEMKCAWARWGGVRGGGGSGGGGGVARLGLVVSQQDRG